NTNWMYRLTVRNVGTRTHCPIPASPSARNSRPLRHACDGTRRCRVTRSARVNSTSRTAAASRIPHTRAELHGRTPLAVMPEAASPRPTASANPPGTLSGLPDPGPSTLAIFPANSRRAAAATVLSQNAERHPSPDTPRSAGCYGSGDPAIRLTTRDRQQVTQELPGTSVALRGGQSAVLGLAEQRQHPRIR